MFFLNVFHVPLQALDASTNKELNGILQGFLKKGQKLYLETEV